MRLPIFALFGFVGLALIAGCNTSGPIACAAAIRVPVTLSLVYPIDNATAVPDSPQAIVVQRNFTGGMVSGLQLVLTPPSGPPIVADVGPVPSPLPTPNSSPSPDAVLVAFSVPTLAPATTYNASFNGTVTFVGGVCPGTFGFGGGGSFTTQ
jgi:hypothetical protein